MENYYFFLHRVLLYISHSGYEGVTGEERQFLKKGYQFRTHPLFNVHIAATSAMRILTGAK